MHFKIAYLFGPLFKIGCFSSVSDFSSTYLPFFYLLNLNANKTGLTYAKVEGNPLTFHIFYLLASLYSTEEIKGE